MAERRTQLIVLGLGILVLVGAAAFFVDWSAVFARRQAPAQDAEPLSGELLVAVGPPGQLRLIQDSGAAPVRAGQQMSLQVRLNQRAFVYLVWIDGRGRVMPLYPWNMDDIEVKDADAPPTACDAASFLFNPSILGRGWKFDKGSGVETVLLFANRNTRLADDARLGSLLAALPAAKLRSPGEVAVLELDRTRNAVTTLLAKNRGDDEDARQADQPLVDAMTKLQDQFELIRAVRFAHEDKDVGQAFQPEGSRFAGVRLESLTYEKTLLQKLPRWE